MGEVINIAEKKGFIKWFLEKYELQNKEAEWLLQYLASNDHILEMVHFIDNFKNLPKTILMSTKCVQMTPFKFYKNRRVTSDVEKAFLDIHNNPKEDIYIGLFFKDKSTCPEYAAVLETNVQVDTKETDALIGLQAEMILDHVLRKCRIEKLYEQIDRSLAENNRQLFFELTDELKKLQKLG
ncbi:YpiB family protein [Effusibacillus dendaii]|uniref:UPF0302 protein YpiB n=1 Tax=Effusibacillus dendaii TaxID=2743772 RepID=A0A7I8D8T3_9BACL|nr:YpiB family protein [Effusibacillus dendaii]BCJ85409.1 UPF0302 protein YpiB [Effusibacillus dendaii]